MFDYQEDVDIQNNNLENKTFRTQAWWNNDWSYYKPITINSSQITSSQTNFPILISITDTDLRDHAQADGGDIAFVLIDNTTQLNHEIENYTSATGTLVCWVNITNLTHDSNLVINMYYGNAGCSNQENIAGTWNSDYLGVWHLNNMTDSTSNDVDLTNNGAVLNLTGKVGNCYDFESTDNDYLTHATFLDTMPASDELTMEAWVWKETNVRGGIIGKINDVGDDCLKYQGHDSANTFRADIQGNDQGEQNIYSDAVSINQWYYTALAYKSGTKAELYWNADSALSAVNIDEIRDGNERDFYIGSESTTAFPFDGLIDECRVSSVRHTDAWLSTSYNTMNNASDGGFFSIGSEKTKPAGATVPIVTTNSATGVEETNATISGTLTDNGTADTTCWFLYGDENPPTDNNVSQGVIAESATFTYNWSSLTPGKIYYFDTAANNSAGFDSSGGIEAFLTKPNPATTIGTAVIDGGANITWTHGTGYNSSVLVRKTDGYPTTPTDGTIVYNNTNNFYVDTSLATGTYYYRVWEYSTWTFTEDLQQFSDGNESTTFYHQGTFTAYTTLTFGGKLDVSGETNDSVILKNPNPANKSTDVSIATTNWNITAEDPEGHAFNWSIKVVNKSTGYIVSTNSSNADTNGSKKADFSGELTYDTNYTVYVNTTDFNNWTNESFWFYTEVNTGPTLSNPNPANESTTVSITETKWNITIEDINADTFNWTITVINSSTGYVLGTNYSNTATNGSKDLNFSGELAYSETYYVYVNTSDFVTWTNESFWFTTESETVFTLYETLTFGGKLDVQADDIILVPSPTNESTDEDMYVILNLTVTDPQGDNMNVSWSTNASGTWIYYNSTVASGSTVQHRALFANESNTKYWWTVRVNDTNNNWQNETYWFSTATYTWSNWSAWWTFNYTAGIPTNFTATTYNGTTINLTWDNLTNGGWDTNVVVRNETGWTTYPITPTNGTEIYNGTLEAFNDTGLAKGTTYYYTIWTWNNTEHQYSITNDTATALTQGDIEIFETSVYPANESTEVERPATNTSIIINGTNLDVYFYFTNYTSATNLTEVFVSWTGENTQRFEFTDFGWTPRTDWMWGNTKYYWSVNVTDGSTWLNRSFNYMSVASASGKNARYDVQLPLGVLSSADAIKTWASVPATYNRVYDVQVPHGVLSSADAQKVWNEVSS